MKPIIDVRQLSKSFKIGLKAESYLTIRDIISNPFSSKDKKSNTFLALDDVSFTVNAGESIGIIGRNGAGKSTLLKILSRITPPSSGKIICRGRIASLLEVGTGFHPELTGRENIYMNGSILGMRRAEIEKHFNDIVEFSGVEKFIDTPLKRYSSGMQLRLAFAVAAHLEPEILIIDEVLAVGDAEFQKKCLGKMNEVSKSGRTVIFVSHDMGAVQNLCTSSILLQNGKIVKQGITSEVIDHYLTNNNLHQRWQQNKTIPNPHFSSIAVDVQGSQPALTLKVEFTINSPIDMKPAFVAFDIANNRGNVLGQAIPKLEPFIALNQEEKTYTVNIAMNGFVPNDYVLSAWIGTHNSFTYDLQKEIIGFSIVDSPQIGRVFPHTPDHGNLIMESSVM